MVKLLEHFKDISSAFIYNGVLWILGEYSRGESVAQSLESILDALGKLPITFVQPPSEDVKSPEEKEAPKST